MTTPRFLALLLAMTPLVLAAQTTTDDTPLLKQGNVVVTLGDVDGFLQQQVPPDKRDGFLDNPKRINQMMIRILRDKQLANQALAMKLDQTQQTKNQLQLVRDQVLSQQRMVAWQAALKTPSFDAPAKEEYLANKADFAIPENVTVLQVLISTKTHSDAEAKALADKVRAEAVSNPAGFSDLIQKYSDDPTKGQNGGSVGNASSSRYVPSFASAAKNLEHIGDISPVVQSPYGYHVLKLTEKVPAKQKDFAEVKGQIIAKLKDKYIDEQRQAFLATLDDAPATADPAGMQAFADRYHLAATQDLRDSIKPQPANGGK